MGNNRNEKAKWVVAPGAGINGRLMENLLPSFWTDSLSRVFEDTAVGIGKRAGKAMKAGAHSYREIGHALGVSPSYAHKLVNGPAPSTRNTNGMDQDQRDSCHPFGVGRYPGLD